MTPKQFFLVLTIFFGVTFALEIPKFALGSAESVPSRETSKYDDLLALDKSEQKELLKLGKILNRQKMALRMLESNLSKMRRSR